MSSPAVSSESVPAVAADPEPPAIGKLYAVLLAGEYAAFNRLIEESAMAPDVRARINIARMVASEITHFERLSDEVVRRDIDPAEAVLRYRQVFDEYHEMTRPKTWFEALVKAYIGDGLAADFYSELADGLPPGPREVVADVLAATGNSEFARADIRAAIAADPALRSPLTLWGRRLLGEAITHAQWVLAAEEEVTDLVFSGAASLQNMAVFFDTVAARHARRMDDLGLG
ncbi:MAG: ferritin-like fold-containing protein [Gordonia sp. (in: high G+C Gram-positive bacteria)]